MTGDLQDLYQEVILDHNKNPRNFHQLPGASHHAEGYNPLCGDKVDVYLLVENDRVKEISFEGKGCAISTASASIMTETVKGKTLAEARALFERFHNLFVGAEPPDPKTMGKMAVLAGVRAFPMRVKCATLAWHTLHAALEDKGDTVSTEI